MTESQQKQIRKACGRFFEQIPTLKPEIKSTIMLALAIMPKENHEQQIYIQTLIIDIMKKAKKERNLK